MRCQHRTVDSIVAMTKPDALEIRKFRKKPVVIEAVQFTGDSNGAEIRHWSRNKVFHGTLTDLWRIETLKGTLFLTEGDWIIRGIQGEFYPCKPDIFKATYEPVE